MKKFFILCMLLILSVSVFSPLSASAKESNMMSDKVFAISRGGDTTLFPENSLEAINALESLNFDAVSATVRMTKDCEFILFENETTKGVCVDKDGNETDFAINESDYKNTLSKLYLSLNGKKTDCKITLLNDALNETDEDIVFILDVPGEILDKVYEKVKNHDAFNRIYFRVRDFSNKDTEKWAEKCDVTPAIISRYKGNVIFSAISTYKNAEENQYEFCEFSVKNRYGVIYSSFFTKRFNNTKALAPVYDKDLCGQRPDTVLGWENLLKSGYSAIETGNAREFSQYLSILDSSYEKLDGSLNEAEKINLDKFTSQSADKFSKALNKCKKITDSKKAASSDEINTCVEKLKLAKNELVLLNGENENESITPIKIFWIIFAIALFASSQIYLCKKTDKK